MIRLECQGHQTSKHILRSFAALRHREAVPKWITRFSHSRSRRAPMRMSSTTALCAKSTEFSRAKQFEGVTS